MAKIKIAGCVILYNPSDNVSMNIETYINYLDHLYVIDNGKGAEVLKKLQPLYANISILRFPDNQGIAHPLNVVLDKAKSKYDYLLTMDQDSSFSENAIQEYLNRIYELNFPT